MGPKRTLKSPINMRLSYKFCNDKVHVSLFKKINIHPTLKTVPGPQKMLQIVVEYMNVRTMSLTLFFI